MKICWYKDEEIGIFFDGIPDVSIRYSNHLSTKEEIEDMLRLYLFWLDSEKARYGDDWIETDYIFTGEKGGLMNPDIITRQFKRITDKNRKTDPDFPHINPHAFRHTVASILLANGTDIVTVSKQLGHASVNTTENFYSHIIEENKAKATECIADVLLRKKA